MNTIPVQIVGVTGYSGGELYRLLLAHPKVEVRSITAKSKVAEPVWKFFPNLRGISDQQVEPTDEASPEGIESVFIATPTGVAMDLGGKYLSKNIKVIDISGDHRLKNPEELISQHRLQK